AGGSGRPSGSGGSGRSGGSGSGKGQRGREGSGGGKRRDAPPANSEMADALRRAGLLGGGGKR
ncbi:hypothetical protein, partial [Streptomyces oceani]|uniref:hypothetical protein n=1 Tax=Streptomyces oceani TaxID=1075402 RepID=UPI001112D5B6